jgi:hypothetical protein
MDCEFENRCLNASKCFRCFNNTLLKLPEDKIKTKYRKNKVYDKRVADSDDSWTDLEQTVADKLNAVPTMQEVRRSRGSGNQWFEKGDVLDEILNLECKERKGNELVGGDKSLSVKRSWLEKAEEEASMENKISALPFRFKNDENIYIIMKDSSIIELVNMCKAYRQDNEVKAREIELLKEQLKDKLKE